MGRGRPRHNQRIAAAGDPDATRPWAGLPIGRVVRLIGASTDAIAVAVDPLPTGAPTIAIYRAGDALLPAQNAAARNPSGVDLPPERTVAGRSPSRADLVAAIVDDLYRAAIHLFPAWLPGTAGIESAGGASVPAVRAIALRTAAVSHHFGPFLADLAETALRARSDGVSTSAGRARFAIEVRAAGLARVLADSYGRTGVALLVDVPDGLSGPAEEALVGAAEWLADRGGFGVWLAGTPLWTIDRVRSVHLPGPIADLAPAADPARPAVLARAAAPARPAVVDPPATADAAGPGPAPARLTVPAVAGRPRADSPAELALETVLATTTWGGGRSWNPTYQPHPLVPAIRVDLLWPVERCVVEIDGPEHRSPVRFAADRQRDVRLQLDGYAVLRFTNAQVLDDVHAVAAQIERFILGRRQAMREGHRK